MPPPTVHILATCDQAERVYGASMVFNGIRVGFPNARVCVTDNHCSLAAGRFIQSAALAAKCEYRRRESATTHYDWITQLLLLADGPIVICDPDVMFWGNVEDYAPTEMVAGEFVPAHWNEPVGCNEVERLHTALMWIDCKVLREAIWRVPVNALYPFDPISPKRISRDKVHWFYDTMAGVYHSFFSTERLPSFVLERFDHLHCGYTLEHVAPKMVAGEEFRTQHKAVAVDPQLLRGNRANLERYYAAHPIR